MTDKIKSVTLAELPNVGSVVLDENGAFTLSFLNLSIRMCERRLCVLTALLKEATLALARAKATKAEDGSTSSVDPSGVVVELPLVRDKKLLN